jgi:hypothetical protein
MSVVVRRLAHPDIAPIRVDDDAALMLTKQLRRA